jgi:hypothetical protein
VLAFDVDADHLETGVMISLARAAGPTKEID